MLGEKRKPVGFNLDNPEERKLYEWACTINFSGFVKDYMRRVARNDDGWSEPVQHNTTHSESK